MVASLQAMHSEAASALLETRTAHAAEVRRLISAQDVLVAAAARDASAQATCEADGRCAALEAQVKEAQAGARALSHQLQVRSSLVCLLPCPPCDLARWSSSARA